MSTPSQSPSVAAANEDVPARAPEGSASQAGPGADVSTSAQRFLSDTQLREQPQAGHLFAIHGLGARGIAEPRFGA